MSRPKKYRKVCSLPVHQAFGPCNRETERTANMTIDEYETIRLIDLEGFTQEQCAEKMEVARTTVQAIYHHARKKLALCLVEGYTLKIDGGDVAFCQSCHTTCKHECSFCKNH